VLVTLVHDKDSRVIAGAMYALARIARLSEGAQAIVNARALDNLLELLESVDPKTREWTCELVGTLANHQSTAVAVSESKPCMSLVSLLHDEYSGVIAGATYALSHIARWSDGAQGVVDARVLDHVLVLLRSPNPETRKWTCILVGRLYSNDRAAPAILAMKPFEQFSFLLRDPATRAGAIFALCAISEWLDGVAVLADDVLQELQELRKSPDATIAVPTRIIMDNLAWYKAEEANCLHEEIGIAL